MPASEDPDADLAAKSRKTARLQSLGRCIFTNPAFPLHIVDVNIFRSIRDTSSSTTALPASQSFLSRESARPAPFEHRILALLDAPDLAERERGRSPRVRGRPPGPGAAGHAVGLAHGRRGPAERARPYRSSRRVFGPSKRSGRPARRHSRSGGTAAVFGLVLLAISRSSRRCSVFLSTRTRDSL